MKKNNYPDLERKSLKKKKKLQVLVMGDTHVGKTSFLTNYCAQQNYFDWNQAGGSSSSINGINPLQDQKVKKTIGCDIHVCYHTPNTRSLITDSSEYSQKSIHLEEEYEVQFWDLAGETKQRQFLNVFTMNRLQELDAILFFFDLTNLKTFQNIYKWLIAIFHNSAHKKDYACVWNIPFLLIGTKIDQIPAKYAMQIKSKLLAQLNKVFLCTKGENLLFLNANDIQSHQQKVEMMMFNLFLSEVCIEKSMRFSQYDIGSPMGCSTSSYNTSLSQSLYQPNALTLLGQSEYAPQIQLPGLNKNMAKYRLNSDNYKNKRIIEEDKSFVQIVMEVNQFSEYKRVWMNHVTSLTSKISVIKNRISSIFFSSSSKNKSKQQQLNDSYEINKQNTV